MNRNEVPDVVVLRLPIYVRALNQLLASGIDLVSSDQLGTLLQMTPAQIRKDLSYFGRFGKQGSGYGVQFLHNELREILGLNQKWSACLIGVGNLGQAIINYPGFAPEGINISAAFDSDPHMADRYIGNLSVRPMSELNETIQRENLTIGIVAVPGEQAQPVIDVLVASGIAGILNYAPIAPYVPMGIVLRNIDPVLSLQSMTFYMLQDI